MSKFHSPLATERVYDGGPPYRLTRALRFSSDVMKSTVVVPKGFRTDLGSVPRLPLAYWLFGNVADEAAVVHDFAYGSGMVTREMADKIFLEAMKSCGTPAWRRWPMFIGVRLFGSSRYTATSTP